MVCIGEVITEQVCIVLIGISSWLFSYFDFFFFFNIHAPPESNFFKKTNIPQNLKKKKKKKRERSRPKRGSIRNFYSLLDWIWTGKSTGLDSILSPTSHARFPFNKKKPHTLSRHQVLIKLFLYSLFPILLPLYIYFFSHGYIVLSLVP